MGDRELMLSRVRSALADVPPDESPVADQSSRPALRTEPDAGQVVETFAQRCSEYRATVTRCPDRSKAIRDTLAGIAQRLTIASLVVPAQIEQQWLPRVVEVRRDEPALDLTDLAAVDATLTACAVAIASTGTIVLDGGAGQGRRAVTLVPDIHLCVVRASQVVDDLPDAFERIAEAIGAGRPITFISGPSATSDIELSRVEGVHGPRHLEVVLAG